VTLDMTNCGNDLLMDTLAVLTRIASVHLAELDVLLVKSRAVSELAMKLLPATRAAERGRGIFDERPNHRHAAHAAAHAAAHVAAHAAAHARAHRAPRRMRRPAVLCTTGVLEYRDMIATSVSPGDAVLEIGCHVRAPAARAHALCGMPCPALRLLRHGCPRQGGTTTRLLADAVGPTGRAVGVDIGVRIVEQAPFPLRPPRRAGRRRTRGRDVSD